ncbi:MAG TPA: transposase [Pyrinomonadaceae bacterium]|jgi:hypothetical protein|nr:transposase [Pyrinomonadaceae bacterium]
MTDLVLEPLQRLTKDLANASITLTVREARYLVDAYYMLQENRIAADHQVRTLIKGDEPHQVIEWLAAQNEGLEHQIKRALDKWTDGNPVGVWAKSICGIGPVISAGLLAHIDIAGCPTVGHIWSFAGLDPTKKWNKGEKRPYNASLKSLVAFKLGESFVKVQANQNDIYGKVYVERKKLEQERNEAQLFAAQAKVGLERVKKTTDAHKYYKEGKLPPAQIHARARRYAVKLFLAHYHAAAFFSRFDMMPPFPYAFSHLKSHVHFLAPPNCHLIEGMPAALARYERELLESQATKAVESTQIAE